jgi:hypothetical protein
MEAHIRMLTEYCWLKILLGKKEEVMFVFVATLHQENLEILFGTCTSLCKT